MYLEKKRTDQRNNVHFTSALYCSLIKSVYMKKLFTSLTLLLAVCSLHGQTIADLSVQIISPQSGAKFHYLDDDISISYILKNNGQDAIDLITDSMVSVGVYSSIDSAFPSPATQQMTYLLSPESRFTLGVDEELTFHTDTVKTGRLFSLYETPFQPGNQPFLYRDMPRAGHFVLFVRSIGFGSGDATGNWVESSDYNDPVDSNNFSFVIIEMQRPISIGEINACSDALQLYPNPAVSGTIYFDYEFAGTESAAVRVADATGKTVLVKDITGSGMQTVQVDVSALNAGLYIMEISTGGRRGISKFTVEN